jgi:hypothetical protein
MVSPMSWCHQQQVDRSNSALAFGSQVSFAQSGSAVFLYFLFSTFLYISLDRVSRGFLSKLFISMDDFWQCRDSRLKFFGRTFRAPSRPGVIQNLAFLARDLCA